MNNHQIDVNKTLIIIKGIDRTNDVETYKILPNNKFWIKFKENDNNKDKKRDYSYNYPKAMIIENKNEQIVEIDNKKLSYNNYILLNVNKVLSFGCFYKVFYTNNKTDIFYQESLKITSYDNEYQNFINGFNYLKKLAEIVGPKILDNLNDNLQEQYINSESNEFNFLSLQYNNINKLDTDSIAYYFLSNKKIVNDINSNKTILYPFGFNNSQRIAINNAISSRISIIEGPPGTGKTQTILNIIANLLVANKTVAVSSNNNFAINNVKEKLAKYKLDFIVAKLGNNEILDDFKKQPLNKFILNKPNKSLENLVNQMKQVPVSKIGEIVN